MSAAEQDDPLLDTLLAGRYHLTSRLGKGGMAVVYKATDRQEGRQVAVKVLRTDVSGDPVAGKRLVREARAAAAIQHPNIISIYDVGDDDGRIYVAMEILIGKELSAVLEDGEEISVERAVYIGQQVASALIVAHAQGIIHRDLKPENLFLLGRDGGDFVKMLDFSIAKLPTDMVTAALTRAGSVFGTPHYMAPEQVQGKQAYPQTDLYALGAILYELVMGDPPFDGKSVVDILLAHIKEPIPHLTKPGVPAALDELVQQLLQKQAPNRPESAQVVYDRLTAILAQLRGSAPKRPAVPLHEQATAPVTADQIAALREAAARVAQPAAVRGEAMETLADLAPPEMDAPSSAVPLDLPSAAPADLPSAAPLDLPSAAAATLPDAPQANSDWSDDPTEARTIMGAGLGAMVREIAAKMEQSKTDQPGAVPSLTPPPAAPRPSAPPARPTAPAPRPASGAVPAAPRPASGATAAAPRPAPAAAPAAPPTGVRETMSGHEAPTAAITLPDDWQAQLKAGAAKADAAKAPPPSSPPPAAPPTAAPPSAGPSSVIVQMPPPPPAKPAPAPAAPVAASSAPAPQADAVPAKSKTGLYVAIAVGVVLAAVAAAVLLRG